MLRGLIKSAIRPKEQIRINVFVVRFRVTVTVPIALAIRTPKRWLGKDFCIVVETSLLIEITFNIF